MTSMFIRRESEDGFEYFQGYHAEILTLNDLSVCGNNVVSWAPSTRLAVSFATEEEAKLMLKFLNLLGTEGEMVIADF